MGTIILKLKPSNEPNLPDHLKHAGIKGMRWGVRRFQNADGTLTELGKHRYAKQVRKARGDAYDESYKKAYDRERDRLIRTETAAGRTPDSRVIDASARAAAEAAAKASANSASRNAEFDIGKEVQKDREATETALRETGNAARTASGFIKNTKVDVPKMDLSKMTDQEMRNAIARARLEGEYDAMFNPARAKAERGRQRAAMVLDGLSAGTAIAGSALGVALMIKQLKGG